MRGIATLLLIAHSANLSHSSGDRPYIDKRSSKFWYLDSSRSCITSCKKGHKLKDDKKCYVYEQGNSYSKWSQNNVILLDIFTAMYFLNLYLPFINSALYFWFIWYRILHMSCPFHCIGIKSNFKIQCLPCCQTKIVYMTFDVVVAIFDFAITPLHIALTFQQLLKASIILGTIS